VSSDVDSYVACRALSMKGRPTSNYRLSPSLFRRNTHNICCMHSNTVGAKFCIIAQNTKSVTSHLNVGVESDQRITVIRPRSPLSVPNTFSCHQ